MDTGQHVSTMQQSLQRVLVSRGGWEGAEEPSTTHHVQDTKVTCPVPLLKQSGKRSAVPQLTPKHCKQRSTANNFRFITPCMVSTAVVVSEPVTPC